MTPWLETQVGVLTEKSPFFIVNNVLIAAKDNLETEVTIPNGVEKIADYAFEGTKFEGIIISDSVTDIGMLAFGDCRVVYGKLKQSRAVCLPNGTDITEKNVHKKIVIYVDKGSPAEKYLRSLKGEEKIAYAYNKNSSATSASYKTYTVKKGDSLWAIAKKQLGNGSRYPEIVKLNQLGKKGIQPGQKLKIPKK